MRRTAILLIVLLACATDAHAGDLSDVQFTPAQNQALNQGDVVVQAWRDETRDDRAIDVFGAIDIDAPPAIIWNIMTDCARTETIVPDMKSCEVVETAPDMSWDIREQKTKINFLITNTSRFRSDYVPNKAIVISGAGGDMKVQEGLWQLDVVTPGKTRVSYRAVSAPSFPISKSRMIQASKDNLPTVLKNFRAAAEADFKLLQ